MINSIKVSVQHNSKMDRYGRLDIPATQTAMDHLSGDGFKLWVSLCLNQESYTANVPADKTGINELVRFGYLHELEDGRYMFSDISDEFQASPELSIQLKHLFTLYGIKDSFWQTESKCINDRLGKLGLSDYLENLLLYWCKIFPQLLNRPCNVKTPIRYDLTVVLIQYIQRHFRFQEGDTINAGQNGERIRFHDSEFKDYISTILRERGINKFIMGSKNVNYWNDAFSGGKFELHLDDLAIILAARKDTDRN